MNKRKIFKFKISRLYAEDIWGIFYRKQLNRDFLIKKLGWLFFLENLNNIKFSKKNKKNKINNDIFYSIKLRLKHKKKYIYYKKIKFWKYIFWKNHFLKNNFKMQMRLLRDNIYSFYFLKDNKKLIYKFKNIHNTYNKVEYFLSTFLKRKLILFYKKHKKKRKIRYIYHLNKIEHNYKKSSIDLRKINKFKSVYHTRMLKVWKLRKFYGNLTKYELKTICHKVYKKRGDILIQFVILLESRLDTVLYRSLFVSSIFEARQWISHKKILVNNNLINKRSYNLKKGDILTLKKNWLLLKNNNIYLQILNKSISINLPTYLEINYKTFMVLFLFNILNVNEVYYNFEFNEKDLNNILYYYY